MVRTFLCLHVRPNCSSLFPSPIGSPAAFLLCSERLSEAALPTPKIRITTRMRNDVSSIFTSFHSSFLSLLFSSLFCAILWQPLTLAWKLMKYAPSDDGPLGASARWLRTQASATRHRCPRGWLRNFHRQVRPVLMQEPGSMAKPRLETSAKRGQQRKVGVGRESEQQGTS